MASEDMHPSGEAEDQPMGIVRGGSRFIATAAAWFGACASCAMAMAWFYDLFDGGTIYPFKSHWGLRFAVLRTASIATLASSWALWFGTRRRRSLPMTLLRIGFATQISLTLFAILGSGIVLGSTRWSVVDVVFPSTFFSEYNWLTFIFEVAPTTSLAASLLLFLSVRCASPPTWRNIASITLKSPDGRIDSASL